MRNYKSLTTECCILSIQPFFRPKFQGVPFEVDPRCSGLQKSEHPKLTNREIISEVFQPMSVVKLYNKKWQSACPFPTSLSLFPFPSPPLRSSPR